jgi:hypothetical protein
MEVSTLVASKSTRAPSEACRMLRLMMSTGAALLLLT